MAEYAHVRSKSPFYVGIPHTFFSVGWSQGIPSFHANIYRPLTAFLSSTAATFSYSMQSFFFILCLPLWIHFCLFSYCVCIFLGLVGFTRSPGWKRYDRFLFLLYSILVIYVNHNVHAPFHFLMWLTQGDEN